MNTARTLTFFIAGLLILLPWVQVHEIEAITLRLVLERPLVEPRLDRVMNRVTVPTASELRRILRSEVRSATEVKTFFAHQAFNGLSAAERREFFEPLEQNDPPGLLRLVPAVDLRHPRAAAENVRVGLIDDAPANAASGDYLGTVRITVSYL